MDDVRKFEFTFQFISSDCLIATVPRESVFLNAAVDPLAPETFTMYGASRDVARKWDEDKQRERKRSDSPGDTIADMMLADMYDWWM